MKTTHDVLDILYPVVDVASVNSTIDGRVYRRKRPVGSSSRDIVLVSLPIGNTKGISIQRGTVMINCYARNESNGMANESLLQVTAAAVIQVLEAYSSGSTYLNLTVVSEGIMQDPNDESWSFVNIRVNYVVES